MTSDDPRVQRALAHARLKLGRVYRGLTSRQAEALEDALLTAVLAYAREEVDGEGSEG